MPKAGGAASKAGVSYKLSWTALHLLDVLQGEADYIYLEPPGPTGKGVEFYISRQGIREYHQTKYQHSGMGKWTLNILNSERVLRNALAIRVPTDSIFRFVSGDSAPQLRALADRAQIATSWNDFTTNHLTGTLGADFRKLVILLSEIPEEQVYTRLKNVRTETIDSPNLQRMLNDRITIHFAGDPKPIANTLRQYALDSYHRKLFSNDVRDHLARHGHRPKQQNSDDVLTISRLTEAFTGVRRTALIRGKAIPRDEADKSIAILSQDGENISLILTGEAGIGKSTVLLQIIEHFQTQGWPVLSFRLDRLTPNLQPIDLGKQLGLNLSPVHALASIAKGKNALLVIDQLDVVSQASGRHPEFFDCVAAMADQIRTFPKLHVIMACRTYDLDNDFRLRNLTTGEKAYTSVEVHRLSLETCKEILKKMNIDPSHLSDKQYDLLTVPLHLELLSSIIDSKYNVQNFSTVNELYDLFWKHKQELVAQRLKKEPMWIRVIDTLCEYMSSHQVLTAPRDILETYPENLEAMASENILIIDHQQVSYFHEGFFDYAFARRFSSNNKRLISILNDDQHLFRRAQVRQILTYERDTDRPRYLLDLTDLLHSYKIRFHIKQAVFSFLTSLKDPTIEELNILLPHLTLQSITKGHVESTISKLAKFGGRLIHQYYPHDKIFRIALGNTCARSTFSNHAWNVCYRSSDWFRLADSQGHVKCWLDSQNDFLVDNTISLLKSQQRQNADRVAELLEPYLGRSEYWDKRLAWIIQLSDLAAGRRFLDLFLNLLDRGVLDDTKGPIAVNSDFWDLIGNLHKKQPSWTCEIIGHYMRRRLARCRSVGLSNPFQDRSDGIPDSMHIREIFSETAKAEPMKFVEELLPFMKNVIAANTDSTHSPPRQDPIWRFRHYGRIHGVESELLQAMELALNHLVATTPEDASQSLFRELEFAQSETLDFLLIRTLTANATRFADHAINFLCSNSNRLQIGYTSNPYQAARLLIEASAPHCSKPSLQQLEHLLLSYYPPWEKSIKGRSHYGWAQCFLLAGIIITRRSETVSMRLLELERKFGVIEPEKPRDFTTTAVGSPIPDDAVKKMTDAQWLSAISQYTDDDFSYTKNHSLHGGASTLANQLEKETKLDPTRFSLLALQFPHNTNELYLNAILRGVSHSFPSIDTFVSLCRYLHSFPNKPCGRWMVQCLADHADKSLPSELLDMVAWYALNDPNPQEEEWKTKNMHGGDLLDYGMNTVRGAAAEAIAALIQRDSTRIDHFLSTLERLVQDSSISVRSSVALALRSLLRYRRNDAIKLFKQLCECDEVLLGTGHIREFLRYAISTDANEMRDLLEKMISSDNDSVNLAGSILVCIAALENSSFHQLSRGCVSGSTSQRKGAAMVFAGNIKTAQYRTVCESSLKLFFSDSDRTVREEAAKALIRLEEDSLDRHENLLRQFILSEAFKEHCHYLFLALERSIPNYPELVCTAVERFYDLFGTRSSNIQHRAAGDSYYAIKLLVRIYMHTNSGTIRIQCLDLFDQIGQDEALGFAEAMKSYERI